MNKEINAVDFISDVLSVKNKLVVFYHEKEELNNVTNVLDKFSEKVPSFTYYTYNCSKEGNIELAYNLGAENTPFLMMFKVGQTNRWLENGKKTKVSPKEILKFIGSPALYQNMKTEDAAELVKEIVKELGIKKEKKLKPNVSDVSEKTKPKSKEEKKQTKKVKLK